MFCCQWVRTAWSLWRGGGRPHFRVRSAQKQKTGVTLRVHKGAAFHHVRSLNQKDLKIRFFKVLKCLQFYGQDVGSVFLQSEKGSKLHFQEFQTYLEDSVFLNQKLIFWILFQASGWWWWWWRTGKALLPPCSCCGSVLCCCATCRLNGVNVSAWGAPFWLAGCSGSGWWGLVDFLLKHQTWSNDLDKYSINKVSM